MMMQDLMVNLSSLGICGLLFVMWWSERQERAKAATYSQDALRQSLQVTEINEHLLGVIRANTEALAALREELRSHRAVEAEWLSRLSRQLETLGGIFYRAAAKETP